MKINKRIEKNRGKMKVRLKLKLKQTTQMEQSLMTNQIKDRVWS